MCFLYDTRGNLLTVLGLLHNDGLLEVLGHFLTRNTHEACLKLEAAGRLESDVDLHLALGIDNTLLVIKFEAFFEDPLDLCCLHLTHLVVICLHSQLDVQVAIGLIRDDDGVSLVEANSNCAKVQKLGRDGHGTIVTSTNYMNLLLNAQGALLSLMFCLDHVQA